MRNKFNVQVFVEKKKKKKKIRSTYFSIKIVSSEEYTYMYSFKSNDFFVWPFK